MREGDDGRARGRVDQTGARGDGRRRSMGALGSSVERVTRRVLGKRALAEASLISQWPSVVGQEFARACQPRRLIFPDRTSRREATLVLRVKPGEATRLAHLEPVLVERVNGFFGYRAVKRLKLEQGELRGPPEPPRRPPQPTLDDSESEAAQQRIGRIEDADLRDALARLKDRLSAPKDGGG